MFMVEIGGMKLLYTGDYSRLDDRHLSAADLPETSPNIGDACSVVYFIGFKECHCQGHPT